MEKQAIRKCNGIMGVPITALDKLDQEIFEIVGMLDHPKIGRRTLYKRLLIRRRNQGAPVGGTEERAANMSGCNKDGSKQYR